MRCACHGGDIAGYRLLEHRQDNRGAPGKRRDIERFR
jgi:hypothetical protein